MHVLFVCWGNICRSPAAECTFRKLLEEGGLSDKITCDSAGTIGSHQGNPPDSRMRQAAQARGLTITGSARMINDQDYQKADLIVTMDDFNFSEVSKLAPDPVLKKKMRPFCDFVSTEDREVPDPYYGGVSGFEKVLDLMDDGCQKILKHIQIKPA
ncbi:low molecular weight phosphotyrosine protein phosphatase [Opitutales bacterium]|nr:low molecular weight phosphotyrosine protein phosphatase [Opitutales bacterium]